MYGIHVHKAVSDSRETTTGITIHQVNEHYDEGAIIAQYRVEITPGESPQSIQEKVRVLEQKHFGQTAETWIKQISKQQ